MNGLSVWKSLGFSRNPYDANPLKACHEDVELLVGRKEEMVELCTVLDSHDHGKAPLPEDVHEHLHRASHGEMRFVFKYSSDICTRLISGVRHSLLMENDSASEEKVNENLGRLLVKYQILTDKAESILRRIILDEFLGLGLKLKDKEILDLLHKKNGARPAHFREFGLKTMQDFSSNYLSRMHKENLLIRVQEGRSVVYKLKGVAALAADYNLLLD